MSKQFTFFSILSVLIFLTGTSLLNASDLVLTQDGKVSGKPFEELQIQINEIKDQINSLQLSRELKVYDADDQYLGIYAGTVTFNKRTLKIFIPELQRSISLYSMEGTIVYEQRIDTLFFESTDCTGTPYVQGQTNHPIQDIFYNEYHDNFVVIDLNPVTVNYKSWTTDENTRCSELIDSNTLFEAVEILLDELPFAYPVQPPLRIEYH